MKSNCEFYATPAGEVMLISPDSGLKVYEPSDRDFTIFMIEKLSALYPEALKKLSQIYEKSRSNQSFFEYRIVHRFIRCNFKEYDDVPDVDTRGHFRFECVSCPLRGECVDEGIVCKPKFNSNLSARELEVMRYVYESISTEEIAEILSISAFTVKKHIRNSLERLSLHSRQDFVSYAAKHRLFDNQ